MPALTTKRLFIAIQFPEEIKDRLEAIQKELKKSGADAKWVAPENIHLTLKFLGNVQMDKIKDLVEILKNFHQEKSFVVTLNQLGVFPSLGAVRVLWAGLNDQTNKLATMANIVDEALNRIGFEKEKRAFQAHATLARVRSFRNKIALIESIKAANQNFQPMDFLIDNITLFESQLSPKGPTYSILHQVKFL